MGTSVTLSDAVIRDVREETTSPVFLQSPAMYKFILYGRTLAEKLLQAYRKSATKIGLTDSAPHSAIARNLSSIQ
jgi:hypothetical protein